MRVSSLPKAVTWKRTSRCLNPHLFSREQMLYHYATQATTVPLQSPKEIPAFEAINNLLKRQKSVTSIPKCSIPEQAEMKMRGNWPTKVEKKTLKQNQWWWWPMHTAHRWKVPKE